MSTVIDRRYRRISLVLKKILAGHKAAVRVQWAAKVGVILAFLAPWRLKEMFYFLLDTEILRSRSG